MSDRIIKIIFQPYFPRQGKYIHWNKKIMQAKVQLQDRGSITVSSKGNRKH